MNIVNQVQANLAVQDNLAVKPTVPQVLLEIANKLKTLKNVISPPTTIPSTSSIDTSKTPHTVIFDTIKYKQLTQSVADEPEKMSDNVALRVRYQPRKTVYQSIRDIDEMLALLKNKSVGNDIKKDDRYYSEDKKEFDYVL
jgi:hypothetical protein